MSKSETECIACGANGKCWNEYVSIQTCSIEGCDADAEYEIPAMLCKEHWEAWFNYELEVE